MSKMGTVTNTLLKGYFDCLNQVKNDEYLESIDGMVKKSKYTNVISK